MPNSKIKMKRSKSDDSKVRMIITFDEDFLLYDISAGRASFISSEMQKKIEEVRKRWKV